MKKTLITSVILIIAVAGYSQHLSINAFGGYTFRDKINFGNAYAYINEGGFWGVSLEGVNQQGTGVELLYQYQSTKIPAYTYPGNIQQNPGQDGAVISYLLLNFEQYDDEQSKDSALWWNRSWRSILQRQLPKRKFRNKIRVGSESGY